MASASIDGGPPALSLESLQAEFLALRQELTATKDQLVASQQQVLHLSQLDAFRSRSVVDGSSGFNFRTELIENCQRL